MFQRLVSHNDDVRRLVEKGYAVAFDTNYLIVRDIPYLDFERKLQLGALVSKLDFPDQDHVQQSDHTVFFAGSVPHGLDGKPIPNLGGGAASLTLSVACRDVAVQRMFSNKPRAPGKFVDLFEKIESYVSIISGPAIHLHGASPYTYRAVREVAGDSVFKFQDTLTSRAEITELSARFKDEVIAIIGLGGTGSYVLDFMVKTPVREIRGFDLDPYQIHNAFRCPGRLDPSELGKSKANVYQARYENFRTGLVIKSKLIDGECAADLEGVTFAFVCVDKGPSRAAIFELLISTGIPFIDVGMGLNKKRGPLNGMMRATYYPSTHSRQIRDKGLAELSERAEDLYRTNIQISELNAMNAALAVIRYKQLRGFYLEELPYYHLAFEVADLKIVGEDDLK